MFEFFIALFGGLFYGGKYSKEKSKLKDYEQRRMIYDSTYDSISSRYMASFETEHWAQDFVSSGKHYDELCDWFADDFEYVFGTNWKEILHIPPIHPAPKTFIEISNHGTWVYHLLLAKQGKIDHGVFGYGYPIGGVNEKDMTVKFAERIERQLLNAGVHGVRLALELDIKYGTTRRTSSDLYGGHMKIESLCHYPTHRLWG